MSVPDSGPSDIALLARRVNTMCTRGLFQGFTEPELRWLRLAAKACRKVGMDPMANRLFTLLGGK